MIRYIVLFTTLISTFTVSIPSAASSIPLVNSEWLRFALWRLEVNGLTGSVFSSSRPYDRSEIDHIIAIMLENIERGNVDPGDIDLQLIRKLRTEFEGDHYKSLQIRGLLAGETEYYNNWGLHSVSLWGAASFRPSSEITLYEEVDIGRGRDIIGTEGRTASKRMGPWKWDYTADFRRAYIHYHKRHLEVLLGRQSLLWSPAYNSSLILSENSPALDMLFLKYRFGSLEAAAFSAVLDRKWSERGDPPRRYLAHRYLAGHRLDLIVNDRFSLGLCEVVLYGGEERRMEIQYINPIMPYYATQWNEDRDDNVFVSADFTIRPVDGMKLYGQFLIDDLQYARGAPNALGYLAGFCLSDPFDFSGMDIRTEYTRIGTWTYTHRLTENQFTHYGWIIGHDIGPDADQLIVELSQIINMDIRLKLIYTYDRQGSHTVEDRYIGESLENVEFPSGVVEKGHRIKLQFLWEPLRGGRVDISFGGAFEDGKYGSDTKMMLDFKLGFLSGMDLDF